MKEFQYYQRVLLAKQLHCCGHPEKLIVLTIAQVRDFVQGAYSNYLQEFFALRAYDSVHLAAALLYRQSKQPVIFGCFDRQLIKAAKILGLEIK